ncbi:MAG: response regulator [Chromatiaceae bacterium]|nr:response regulator [Chromatiaceae bacterium]
MTDKPTAKLSQKHAVATVLSGIALLGYVAFLLYSNFQAAAGLQDLLRDKVHQETERRAGALEYFFAERRDDLQNLSLAPPLFVYFDNKAKGIGITEKADRRYIQISFENLIKRKQINGSPIYRRILLIDANGDTVADTLADAEDPDPPHFKGFLDPNLRQGAILTLDEGRALLVSSAHFLKEQFAGQILAWLNPQDLYRAMLTHGDATEAFAPLLVSTTAAGLEPVGRAPNPLLAGLRIPSGPIPRGPLRYTAKGPNGPIAMLASISPVAGTPLHLVEIAPVSQVEGNIQPWQQMLGLGLLAALVLGGLVMVFRLNLHAAALEAHLTESARREQEVQDKNRALEAEIAERLRAEAALAKGEREFRAIANYTYDWENWTDPQGRLLWVNPAVERLTGYRVEECLRMPDYPLPMVYPEDRPTLRQALENCGVSQGSDLEFRLVHKHGQVLWAALSWQPIYDTDGTCLGQRSSIRDVSERRRATEAMVAAKEAAEAANQAKSEFLASMSHEIRTPMNGVIGMTGLLLDTALNEEQREFVEIIRSSGDALLTVINDILDYSKIEANKMVLEVAGFDLRTTVEDVADILAQRAYEKGLEFTCLLPREIPVRLRGDSGRLRQILVNLTGNAIKFTERGEVAIEIKRVDEGSDPGYCDLLFRIIDTGIGIPEAGRDRLFRSFSQVDASTTKRYGGTGLGLAISKRLTEMMGGSIGVDSTPGKGSTFWFALPFKVDATVTPLDPGSKLLVGKQVLVVDDNATNLRVFREYLGAYECVVHQADNADQALLRLKEAIVDKHPVEIVILDMMMPDTDGLTLGKTILANEEFGAPKLIMLSSRNQIGDAAALERAGFAAFLPKPVKSNALHRTLLRLFEERTPPRNRPRSTPPRQPAVADGHTSGRPFRILVAEDNVTNQMVALAILGQLGYRADAVSNGQEALDALYTVPYDLVLMDVQMPEMDGLEATRLYRLQEAGTGKHKPIIAMTAFATVDDRERCLGAGMDDFLTKPVQRQLLAATLACHLKDAAADADEKADPPEIAAPPERVFRIEDLLDRLDNDIELAAEIAEVYLGESEHLQTEIAAALERGDAEALRNHAHSIKGATGNIGNEPLHEVAFQLENSGRVGNLARGAEVFPEFQRLLAATNAVLQRFLDSRAA